jgi:hypothetical protein
MYATTHHQYVLQLDIQGTPQAWLSIEEAATYVATESVAWTNGDGPLATLRGGFNVRSGRMSTIEVYPIIALHGSARVNLFDRIPTYSRHKLCRRDRFMCAYCGDVRPERELSADHIVPQAQGGRWCWTNLVTACKGCNGVKGNRTPEQAGMPLLYLPYVPNLFEDFLLKGRNIRADVHVWLASRLPRGSRLQ